MSQNGYSNIISKFLWKKKKKILFLNLIEPIQRVYPMIGEPTINSSMRFGFTPLWSSVILTR